MHGRGIVDHGERESGSPETVTCTTRALGRTRRKGYGAGVVSSGGASDWGSGSSCVCSWSCSCSCSCSASEPPPENQDLIVSRSDIRPPCFDRSADRTQNSSASDEERRAHATRAVVRKRAPERVAAGRESRVELADAAGADLADQQRPRSGREPAQREVVAVLAEVDELDDRRAGAERRTREGQVVLVGADLEPGGP